MAWEDKVIETRGTNPYAVPPQSMWEILVPTEKRIKTPPPPEYRIGTPNYPAELEGWQKANSYTTRYHRVWDAEVRRITGGLTILTPAKGQWVSPDGELFSERMIPVRIVCTRAEIDRIIDFTLQYYDQLAVFCARVSDEVIIRHRRA